MRAWIDDNSTSAASDESLIEPEGGRGLQRPPSRTRDSWCYLRYFACVALLFVISLGVCSCAPPCFVRIPTFCLLEGVLLVMLLRICTVFACVRWYVHICVCVIVYVCLYVRVCLCISLYVSYLCNNLILPLDALNYCQETVRSRSDLWLSFWNWWMNFTHYAP